MKMLKITLQGKTYEVGVEFVDGAAPATAAPAPVQAAPAVAVAVPVAAPAPAPAPAAAAPAAVAGGQSVTSPMPGLVMKVRVTVGQQVTADQQAHGLGITGGMNLRHDVLHKCHLRCRGVGRQHGRAAFLGHACGAKPREVIQPLVEFLCALTGRGRGTFKMFGLGRNKIRELAFKGDIPGVVKASW